MDFFEQIQQAADFVRSRVSLAPKVGCVLGSGLGAFAERVEGAVEVNYSDIPHFPSSSVTGHAGQLVIGKVSEVPIAVMSGRVHYYEGYDMDRVTFPVRVLRALGASDLLVTNAAGGVNPKYAPGHFMLITDHLNLTGGSPLRGPNDERMGVRFPDMSSAYTASLLTSMMALAQKRNLTVHQGVYAGVMGPAYETPAEIRMLRGMGADAVGMSTVSEVIAAVHAGMRVAGLSVITNHAAGVTNAPLSHAEVKAVGEQVRDSLCDFLAEAVADF